MTRNPARRTGAPLLAPITFSLALAASGGAQADAPRPQASAARGGEPSPVALQAKCRTLVDKKLGKGAAHGSRISPTGPSTDRCPSARS